jgi:hypothetical protein
MRQRKAFTEIMDCRVDSCLILIYSLSFDGGSFSTIVK